MKYRILEANEALRDGDRGNCYWDEDPDSTKYGTSASKDQFGRLAGDWNCGFWRRPVASHGWISFKDRMPTRADSDGGMIVVRDDRGALSLAEYSANQQTYYHYFTHWQALNFKEPTPTRVKIDNHEITPQKDGSLKIGCKTLDKEQVEEILRQRQEAMGK